MTSSADIERVFRAEYGRCVATLIRLFGDIDLAEEAVQDAFTAAHAQLKHPAWGAGGITLGAPAAGRDANALPAPRR